MNNTGEQIKQLAKDLSEFEKRYHEEDAPFKNEETIFLPIRHFNSDYPITPGLIKDIPFSIANQPVQIDYDGKVSMIPSFVGGGYYLWHKGKGIAIDPGYGFINSLHRYHKVNVRNIDAVIITHDHLDHHADLETLINLKRGTQKKLKIFANQELSFAYQLYERSINGNFGIDFHMLTFDIIKEYTIFDNISILLIPTLHWQRVLKVVDHDSTPLPPNALLKSHFNAFGLQLSLNDIGKRILITGDTLFPISNNDKNDTWFAYEQDIDKSPYLQSEKDFQLGWTHRKLVENKNEIISIIEQKCQEMVNSYKSLKKSDIICIHLGSIEKGLSNLPDYVKDPVQFYNERHNVNYCYNGFHLGFMGTLRLLEILIKSYDDEKKLNKGFDLENGLIILTEFGEELLGNRQNICVLLSHVLQAVQPIRGNPAILPSEVTLRLQLNHETEKNKQGAFSTYRNKLHDWKIICAKEGPGETISYFAKGHENDYTNHP